jgi:hypothetical protein
MASYQPPDTDRQTDRNIGNRREKSSVLQKIFIQRTGNSLNYLKVLTLILRWLEGFVTPERNPRVKSVKITVHIFGDGDCDGGGEWLVVGGGGGTLNTEENVTMLPRRSTKFSTK